MTPEKRERMSAEPQRLPNGQWRCEVGSAVGDKHWCPNAAAWIMQGCTVRTPGAVVCDECYRESEAPRRRIGKPVSYVPLENAPEHGEDEEVGRACPDCERGAEVFVLGRPPPGPGKED